MVNRNSQFSRMLFADTRARAHSFAWNPAQQVRGMATPGPAARTPLREAVASGDADAVKQLLAREGAVADIDERGRNGETALFGALQHAGIARLLLFHGANASAKNAFGQSLLHEVTVRGTEEVALMLLDAGADASAVDMHGDNALCRAMWAGMNKMFVRIVSGMESCHSADANGDTPLHIAAHLGRVDMARALLAKGCVLDYTNNQGESPLFVAVSRNQLAMVCYLIRRGSSVHLVNKMGDSALHVAVRMQIQSLTQTLLRAGANPRLRNGIGLEPLDLCRTKRHVRVRAELERACGEPRSAAVTCGARVREDVSERNTKRRRRRKQFVSVDSCISVVEMLA